MNSQLLPSSGPSWNVLLYWGTAWMLALKHIYSSVFGVNCFPLKAKHKAYLITMFTHSCVYIFFSNDLLFSMNINLWIPCRANNVNIILLFIKTFKKIVYELFTSGLFHTRLYLEMLISALLLNIFEVIITDIWDLEMKEFILKCFLVAFHGKMGIYLFSNLICAY